MSTPPQDLPDRGDARRFRGLSIGLAATLLTLGAYLFRAAQSTGDGAAYTLQALTGTLGERTVHWGFLAPLTGVVRIADAAGVDPSAAANLLSAAWTLLGLGAAAALGQQLLRTHEPSPGGPNPWALLAPLSLAAAPTVWDAALFCEVYGPLAATTTGCAWALRAGRDRIAVVAMVGAFLVHPAALALGPGLLLLGGVRLRSRRAVRGSVAALALAAGCVVLLGPDWWTGGRGVLRGAPVDRSVFEALQAAVRALSRDLGAASAPILVGVLVAVAGPHRRAALGVAALAAGGAVTMGRWSDTAAALPALFAAAALAPLAATVAFGASDSARRQARLWGPALVVVAWVGVADATSVHDTKARAVAAEWDRLEAECAPRDEPWRSRMRRELACAR